MIWILKQPVKLRALVLPLLIKSENVLQKNVNLGIIIEIKTYIFVL